MRTILFFSFLIVAHLAQALPNRERCLAKDLERQDCRLQIQPWKLQLSNKTVAWTDGVWQTVDALPISGEGLTWEKVTFRKMKKRMVLQMWLWNTAVGESQVQTLHWLVFEFKDKKMSLLLNEPVGKRHRDLTKMDKVKYVKDPVELHGLADGKGEKLKWHHLKKSGEL